MAPVQELRFHVVIADPKVPNALENAVGFGEFAKVDGDSLVYPKDGAKAFFEDLILGRPFPLTLVTTGLDKLGILVALTVFLSRDLAIHPVTPNLLVAADLVDRYHLAGLAHVDRDLARFFSFLVGYIPPELGRQERESRLSSAVTWIRQYILEGTFPALPPEPPMPRVIDRGTNGFVVAEVSGQSLELGWLELYRQGFLRGIIFGQSQGDRQVVLGARKSSFLPFDMRKAAEVFNEAELRMGEPAEWKAEELWLRGPEEGTLLLPSMILDVLLRV